MQFGIQRGAVAQKLNADIAVLVVKALDEVLGEQLHDGSHLFQRALPVLGRESIEIHRCYAKFIAVVGNILEHRRTFFVSCGAGQAAVFRPAAIAVHDALWESGEITTSMSDYEKARVYFTWICDNCVYDYTAGDSSLSHIAYSLFENGTAVCDGYTGAYNLLLKLEGIDCTALSNNSHIWTVATLDGTDYHIDTTWGDSGPAPNYDYFAMTAEESWQHHSW